MNLNYEEVPNIITGKDLDYLSDMFDWNLGVVKSAHHLMMHVKNEEIKSFLEEVFHTHQEILHTIIDDIKGGSNE